MANEAKKPAAAKWSREGAVFTVTWAHGPIDSVDTSKWNDVVREGCFYNGAKQTLGDSYALGVRDEEIDGKKVTVRPTPEEKRDAFLERLESLNNGTYAEGRGTGEPRAYVMLAMQRLYPGKAFHATPAAFDEWLEKSAAATSPPCKAEKLLRSLRENDRVAAEIAKIKAERGIQPVAVDDILAGVENLPDAD